MKLTDDERAFFNDAVERIELDIEAGETTSVFMLKDILRLAKSEQAAWQEVDRLKKENERLNLLLDDSVETLRFYVYCDYEEYIEDIGERAEKTLRQIGG